MKKNLIFLLIAFCLIGNVMALDGLGTFKQGEIVRISQVCSDATYINISSISYPNSTVAVSNIEMTSSGSGEYYYDFSLTDTAGRYDVRGISDGCEMTFATYFNINISGSEENTGKYIFLGSLLIVLFCVSCFMMYLSNVFNEVGFKIFFLISSLVFIIATLGVGLLVMNNVLSVAGVSEILVALISVIGAMLFIVFIWILIRQTINALDMYKMKKGHSWNVGAGSSVGGFNTRRAY